MSEVKISEAAIEAGAIVMQECIASFNRHNTHGYTRAVIEAALPHLQPQPAELAEQQGVREQFEAWARKFGHDLTRRSIGREGDDSYIDDFALYAWTAWQAALAATGKQQVGEVVEDERFPGGFADAIAYVNELEELAETLHAKVFGHESDGESGASTLLQMTIHQLDEKLEQVGEVQVVREQFIRATEFQVRNLRRDGEWMRVSEDAYNDTSDIGFQPHIWERRKLYSASEGCTMVSDFLADCASNRNDVHIPTVRSERAIKLLALIEQRDAAPSGLPFWNHPSDLEGAK